MTQNRVENRARDILVEAIRQDPELSATVRRVFYDSAGLRVPNIAGKWFVETEYSLRSGGFVDILMHDGEHALGLEVKVKDGEKLSQYTYYPKILAEQFTVCFCGLIGAREVRRGRRAILEPFLSEAADTRLTWGELIEQLSQQLGEKRVSPLKNALVSLQPDILDGGRFAYNRKQEAKRDIRHLVFSPATVVAFFNDYVREMGDGFEAEPWQAGNAPTQILLGRNGWSEWFGDGFPCRLGLSLGIQAPDPYLDFVIILWNKTMCGGTLDIVRLQEAARFFTLKGYKIQRNLPGKWHITIQSDPPVVRESGFFFCNIFDAGRYRLPLAKAEQLGWDKSVQDVAERAKSLVSLLDSLVG